MKKTEALAVHLKKVDLPNGETLSYREREGGEKTVLLVHGNMTSSKHWDLLIDRMDSEFKIIAVDMRGFGESTYHKKVMSIKDFSDDIKLFVDALALKDFAMIGWSTGGAVCMQFAADNPGYCDKLILLESASTRGYPFFGVTPEGLPDTSNRVTTYEDVKVHPTTVAIQTAYDQNNRDFLKATWNMLIYTKNQPDAELYEEYVDDMLTQRTLAEVYHSLNTFNISSRHNGLIKGTDQVKDIKIPVLVLWGDRDLVVNKLMTEEILADFGGHAKYVELTDCGHSPLVDDLEQLNGHIEAFLK
ncbi:intracellular short-chain-length polyhydroxyalkanoate depolymerase [Bacillus sp. FJAT-18017]|uniref:intracellular short-chain-length polyhydroxyalkanoate depolymerase n=1 Tax=Bacillus sp. FJAT-18017 TaxID=1705566 RepID=UPI001E31246E|nr:alpha/beta hydrolase [Bacillus sp. FJAT-18017]